MKPIRFAAALALSALIAPTWAVGGTTTTAPNLLTYQGRLQESGALITGNRDVNMQICDALSGGTCNATGLQTVTVTNGLFRTTFTVPSAVNLAAGPWYLEVRVGPVGGGLNTLSPREELTSAPFAVVASTANFVDVNRIGAGAMGSGVLIAGAIGTGAISQLVYAGTAGTGVLLVSPSIIGPGSLGTGLGVGLTIGTGVLINVGAIGTGVLSSTAAYIRPSGIYVGPNAAAQGMVGTGVLIDGGAIGTGVIGTGVTVAPGAIGAGTLGTGIHFANEVGLTSLSSAQISAKTPSQVGTLVYNNSVNLVCVSTGTTAGSYARVGNGAACQ